MVLVEIDYFLLDVFCQIKDFYDEKRNNKR
jgi:hypothetical protein